ncbi:IS630 transposase-related protein [Limnothrix redekei]|uniref:IS630 transposase-related protein n=1 Tax=Limnothrix redekei LRLZ20PSL1 TaxID=3112953 RepID=A0ABW7C8S7_9CYAN
MKAYSVDLREKIVAAHLVNQESIRKVAARFSVAKSLVQKLVKQYRTKGNLALKHRGKPRLSHLSHAEAQAQVRDLVAERPDATLKELCESFAQLTGHGVSSSAMHRCLNKLKLSRKKNSICQPSRYRKSARAES